MPLTPKVVVDEARHEVRVDGIPAKLARREFMIVVLLAKAGGRVLSRVDLLREIWDGDFAQDIESRTVDQHISRTRRALRAGADCLVTVPGYGYKAVGIEFAGEDSHSVPAAEARRFLVGLAANVKRGQTITLRIA